VNVRGRPPDSNIRVLPDIAAGAIAHGQDGHLAAEQRETAHNGSWTVDKHGHVDGRHGWQCPGRQVVIHERVRVLGDGIGDAWQANRHLIAPARNVECVRDRAGCPKAGDGRVELVVRLVEIAR